jgi:hypothetical protein
MMIAVAPSAEAHGFRHRGFGFGALAAGIVVGGAAAAIASQAYAAPARECYLTRQWVDTPYGMERRTVRVCN